jgi:nucleoside-triphosphatase THEP1
VGKTFLIKKVVQKLQEKINVKGFVTEDMRDRSNKRYGFDVVNLENTEIRAPLARLTDQLSEFFMAQWVPSLKNLNFFQTPEHSIFGDAYSRTVLGHVRLI